ncbi:MAG: aldo/keto reductase [Spirochaetota bacterium]
MISTATLPQIQLGATGRKLSRLALGGFHQVEITTDIIERVVDRYVEYGGNYIETARGYGRGASEEKIGRVLAGRRDQFVLASKSSSRDGEGMKRELDASLTALKTDRIEFYFLHGVNTREDLDRLQADDGALRVLTDAKDAGTIEGIGLSSHRPWIYLDALKQLPLSLILIWDNYLEEQYLPIIHNEIYPLAKQKGVGITAMKPLADGFLYRSPRNALRYALGSGADVLVCGMNSVEHVDQAADALSSGPASDEEREDILRTAPELGRYVCRQCGACPESLMHLFRLEGYYDRQMIDYLEHDPADYALRLRLAKWFALAEHAEQEYASAAWKDDDLLAGAEEVDCPYDIDVPRKTRLAQAKLSGADPNRI